MKKQLCLAWMVIVGCGDSAPLLEPVVDVPPASSDAYPYTDLEEIFISVAQTGEQGSIREARFEPGEQLVLPDIPFGSDLVIHMSGRSRGQEIAYGRTCSITLTADRAPPENEPHLYFSNIIEWGAEWSASAAPFEPDRVGGYGVALSDGRAVFAGGGNDATTVERFDPQSGSFVRLDVELAARAGRVFTSFADGRFVVTGGIDSDGDGVAMVELVDPRPDVSASAQLEQLDGPILSEHTAIALADDTVLVTGGMASSGTGQPLEATSAAWQITPIPGGLLDSQELRVTMQSPRVEHSMTRLGDATGADVLIIGGRDRAGLPVAQAELYRPLRESFQPLDTALLNVPRWGHTAVRFAGGFVLVVGGFQPDPGGGGPLPVAEIELYDPVDHRFDQAGMLSDSAGFSEFTVTRLPDGGTLLAGGRGLDGEPVSAVQIARFDAVNGRVSLGPTKSLRVARAGHSAVRLCDGTVLIIGGTSDPGALGSERYNPASDGRR